ncbi:MAG TPA: hypothetical protein VJB59_01800 [Bdellovibrionota bacterium]|nr:hypothetical protein [Bdellovibrionota bacterium]
MRLALIGAVLLSSVPAFATHESSGIRVYNMGACPQWTISNDGFGFVCTSMPSTVTLPDAYSVADEIRGLKRRIEELENRIAELEKPKQ